MLGAIEELMQISQERNWRRALVVRAKWYYMRGDALESLPAADDFYRHWSNIDWAGRPQA